MAKGRVFLTGLIERPAIIISLVLVVGTVSGLFYFLRDKKQSFSTVVASRGDVIQEVGVTGRVEAAQSVELAFEKVGRVSRVNVGVGDKVFAGQVLVSLENADLRAQLTGAEANVKLQQAKLDEFRQGTRLEEIEIQEAKVEDAKQKLIDKLQDAYTKSDDAIRNKVDQFFTNPRGPSPQIDFSVPAQLETKAELNRLLLEVELVSWRSSLDGLTSASNLNSYATDVKERLDHIKSFLEDIALILSDLDANANLSQTTIDGYRSDVSTARTNVNTAINNLSVSESDFIIKKNELALKKAGTADEQITAQEAQVENAIANVQNYEAQVAKTIIRSPINGIVTKQGAKIGEIVSASTVVVSVISEADFEIGANIPESDIAKIKIGNRARITLDAYGSNVIFEAGVFEIEPAETIIEGVATYKTTLQFFEADPRIKPGMTANIDILTDKRENVIAIPQRAIITKNGDTLIRVLKDGVIEDVMVKTGLRGSDGRVEITEGIHEGDEVIVFIRE